MASWASGDAAAKSGASTPLVTDNKREAPPSAHVYGEDASRAWLIAYREYSLYVESCNGMGVLGREQLTPERLMPSHVKQVFTRKHGSGGQDLDNNKLLRALERHTGFVVSA